jgi:hypothetical protein
VSEVRLARAPPSASDCCRALMPRQHISPVYRTVASRRAKAWHFPDSSLATVKISRGKREAENRPLLSSLETAVRLSSPLPGVLGPGSTAHRDSSR